MQTINLIFPIVILIFSAIVHEVAHGYAALFQGDPTAKYENRLTLNPINHIDPFGTIILPLLMLITTSAIPGLPRIIFGWAKPVPFNPYNLRNRRWGEAIVAVAGPGINLAIAVVFGFVLRFGWVFLPDSAFLVLKLIVFYNILLAIFNLVPIAPLDGSKILFALLPTNAAWVRRFMERYSIFLVLFLIFVLWSYIFPVVTFVFGLITGMQLG
jgi:Zn-dependent protease